MNQPDFSIYLIFLFGIGVPLLVLPAAFYMRRHWSLQKRLAMAPFIFAVATIGFAALIGANYRKSGGHLFACIFGMLWLTQSIMVIYVWHKMRREVRQSAAVGRPPVDKVDPFFWQGLLILLPVLIMALVAGTAIIKDRSSAEREARQRAADILQQINRQSTGFGFGTKLDEHRFNYEVTVKDWTQRNLEAKIFPPGDIFRSGEQARENDSIMAKWRADVPPALVEKDSIKFWPSFNADGGMRPVWSGGDFKSEPPAGPPCPPPWRVDLTPEQAAAWDGLCRSALIENDNPATRAHGGSLPHSLLVALQAFKATHPSQAAIENAEFVALQVRLATQPASNAIPQLLLSRFSKSESGIPLSSLALAEALKRAVETGPSQDLWDQVALDTRVSPSLFTPVLLSLAEPVFGKDAVFADCLKALNSRWAAQEQMWAVGELIQRSGKLQGLVETNLWLDFEGSRWFCTLLPEGNNKEYISSHIYPMSAISWGFKRAFQEVNVAVPRYMELRAEIEGSEAVSLWPETGVQGRPRGVMLAEAAGQRPSAADPPYVLRIYLADAGLMLAAQKKRALIMGGLIAVSALAAFVGFLAARRAFYRQLRLSEMKSDFVSSVSHELRAPIASVRLMAEGLERGRISEPGKQHEYFKFIVQECRRLSSLIENVLDFSRIEQGRKQYEMESTDLVALTEKTVTLMETYAAERQVNITLKKIGEPAPVELDGKAMQQALVNLIDNAIKHSPKGAEIVVGLEFSKFGVRSAAAFAPQLRRAKECGVKTGRAMHEAGVLLWVEDTGEGIPAAEHEKIFERFYRVGSELRRETQGVGIGLSIVKHIVEAHGGRVTVRSAPGEGSRFTIELPMDKEVT